MLELASLTRRIRGLTENRKTLVERFCQLKKEVDRELAAINVE